MGCQSEYEIGGQERATVRMPHWGDETHLGRIQGKVLRERQPSLENASFATTRVKIRANWTAGIPVHSLESVGWPEKMDRETIITRRVDIVGNAPDNHDFPLI